MTTETKHTLGPLDNDGGFLLSDGRMIGQCYSNMGTDNKEANARRVVACWNACAAMDDPERGIRETAALLNRTYLSRDAVTKQRDELAAALRAVLEWADPGPQPTHVNNLRDQQKAFAVLDKLQS